MGFSPCLVASTPTKMTNWKMKSPRMTSPIMKKMTSPITKRLVKTFSGEVPNFNDEDVDYVDFLGVKDILNSPRDDYGEFYTDEENYMFTRETIPNPFLSIFMAHGREKERQKNGKSEVSPSGVWDFHNNHQGIPTMRSITIILGCCLVLILRKGKWNKLTRHPKDRGKNWLNSRSNSLQPEV
jgi:hypothetical protein